MDIRLDGYWWKELQSNVPSIEIYFFYKNGIALYERAVTLSEIEVEEEEFR